MKEHEYEAKVLAYVIVNTRMQARVREIDANYAPHVEAALEILSGEDIFLPIGVTGSIRDALISETAFTWVDSESVAHHFNVKPDDFPDTAEGLKELFRHVATWHIKSILLVLSEEQAQQAADFVDFVRAAKLDACLIIVPASAMSAFGEEAVRKRERHLQQRQGSAMTVNAILRDLAARVRYEIASAPAERCQDAEHHMLGVGKEPSPDDMYSIFAAALTLNFGFRGMIKHVNGVLETE